MAPSGLEGDEEPLMGTKQAVRPALPQQGEVGVGAKSAIAAHNIAGPQFVVRPGYVGQVVRAQRRRDGLKEIAGVSVELYQQMGRRKTATVGLLATLAEGSAEVGRVGHGKTGAVQEEDAVPVPQGARVLGGKAAAAVEDGGVESVKEGQGQALASVAVGRVGERKFGEASQLGDWSVAFQDLSEKQVRGNEGRQEAVADGELELPAQGSDERRINELHGIALDALEGLRHIEHGGLRR
jgi:hypothetical protein